MDSPYNGYPQHRASAYFDTDLTVPSQSKEASVLPTCPSAPFMEPTQNDHQPQKYLVNASQCPWYPNSISPQQYQGYPSNASPQDPYEPLYPPLPVYNLAPPIQDYLPTQSYLLAQNHQPNRSSQSQPNGLEVNAQLNQANIPKSKPTVFPKNPFSPTEDAAILKKAIKGFRTDKKALIQLLTRRTNEQRLSIVSECKDFYGWVETYNELYAHGKTVIFRSHELLSNPMAILGQYSKLRAGVENFLQENPITLTDPLNYLATCLRNDPVTLLSKELSGKFGDLIVALLTPLPVYYAQHLHHMDKSVFTEVMCTMSDKEITLIELIYSTMYEEILLEDMAHFVLKQIMSLKKCLSEDITAQKNGELANKFTRSLLLSAGQGIRNKPLFFAERLYKAMIGKRVNHSQLIRIMIRRCEEDMDNIAKVFKAKYGDGLDVWIENTCDGYYKKCLLGLLGLY